ncbi:MAG TPA: hypothetical protein VEQ37_10240 [Actinomycetota bacterium]|nr:hypothetical protein [Actinomycetota bacterium]
MKAPAATSGTARISCPGEADTPQAMAAIPESVARNVALQVENDVVVGGSPA